METLSNILLYGYDPDVSEKLASMLYEAGAGTIRFEDSNMGNMPGRSEQSFSLVIIGPVSEEVRTELKLQFLLHHPLARIIEFTGDPASIMEELRHLST
jgi:hypothetical protein